MLMPEGDGKDAFRLRHFLYFCRRAGNKERKKTLGKRYDLESQLKDIDMPVILFENVSKEYQSGIPALKNVNIEIRKGEFVFIVGNSGSGKSTLIKLMLKEIKPTSGRVYVAGKLLEKLRSWQVAKFRRKLGIVFQDFRLLPDRSVFENVAFAQHVIEAPAREVRRQTPRMLALVGLSEKAKAMPKELSGGEQQRVAIARAIAHKPKIIFADEPTAELDTATGLQVMKIFKELIDKEGVTIVMTTHDLGLLDIADCIYHLEDGEIIDEE